VELEVKNLSCGYLNRPVVSNVSLKMSTGESLCLLGPNGVGKTTFFKTILGLLKPRSGQIFLDGEDVSKWPRRKFAAKVGYVPQYHMPPFAFEVLDVVIMGRNAHLGSFASPGKKDRIIAEQVLDTLNISYLSKRVYTEISGGERQLVLIARALAQEPEFLVMDEPTASLDFGNQIKVLNQINQLATSGKVGVIMTTHYPDHAFYCASKVAVMGKGDTFVFGTPDEVITEAYLQEVYDVKVKIILVENGDVKRKVCVSAV